jgi:hypothetical protein
MVGTPVLLSGCGTPTEVRDFGLARLDIASELMTNPQVVAIGSLQARVRISTSRYTCRRLNPSTWAARLIAILPAATWRTATSRSRSR